MAALSAAVSSLAGASPSSRTGLAPAVDQLARQRERPRRRSAVPAAAVASCGSRGAPARGSGDSILGVEVRLGILPVRRIVRVQRADRRHRSSWMTMRDSDRYIGVAEYDSSIAIATTIAKTADQPHVLEHDREPIEQMHFGNGVQQRTAGAGRQVRHRGRLNWRELDIVGLSEPRAGRLAAVGECCHAYRGCRDRRRRRVRDPPYPCSRRQAG